MPEIEVVPPDAALLAKAVIPSLTALANLAKSLLNENKALKTSLEVPAPIIAAHEARTLSQIEAALAPMTQLKDAIAPLQTLTITPEQAQEIMHAVGSFKSDETIIHPSTFEQQIEEAKTE
jgi:hypothetical protein